MGEIGMDERMAEETVEVSDRIFTLPNVISFIRLLMVPAFLVLLFNGYNLAATLLFALAASTDCVDGQIARRTNTVTKLGQLLDPAVDRVLMVSGVAAVYFAGYVPAWIILFVLFRDLLLLAGGAYILKRYNVRVPVIFAGKVCTTFMFIGFAGLLLNWPLIPGLGLVDVAWLPGFNTASCSWGIWFIYAGLALGVFTTAYYIVAAGFRVAEAHRSVSKA